MESSKTRCYVFFLICMLFISLTTPILGCGSCDDNPPPKKEKPGSKSPKGPINLPPIIVKPPITLPPIIGKPPITLPPIIGKPPITLPPIIGKPPITLPPIIGKPPITLPPIIGKPPITLPPIIGKPPITLPPIIGKPPITLPPITLPPIEKPPLTLPPILNPPVTLPPIPIPPITIPPVTGLPPIITNPPSTKPCPPPPGKDTCSIDKLRLNLCMDVVGIGGLVHFGSDAIVKECCPVLKGLVDMEAAVCLCETLKFKALNLNVYVPLAFQLLDTCGKKTPPGYTCSL